jgi:YHS domain-containing protein
MEAGINPECTQKLITFIVRKLSIIRPINDMKTSILIMLALVVVTLHTASAETKILINTDKEGVGLQGYDPVGFFTENKPVKGNPATSSSYHGVIYHFASEENKSVFVMNPTKYEPQFGGFCAYGVTRDSAAPIKVEAFQIINGRLLLQYDEHIRDLFNKDTENNLKLADQKWPSVLEKKGASKAAAK